MTIRFSSLPTPKDEDVSKYILECLKGRDKISDDKLSEEVMNDFRMAGMSVSPSQFFSCINALRGENKIGVEPVDDVTDLVWLIEPVRKIDSKQKGLF